MQRDHAAYGVRNGKAVHVSDAPRGLACGCACAQCGRPLVARKGDSRRHHFAHRELTDCGGGVESVLHLLAKEIFGELQSVRIPPYRLKLRRATPMGTVVERSPVVANGGVVSIKSSSIEFPEHGMRPDITLHTEFGALLIEVAVSHKVGKPKLRKLRQRGLAAIEIRLTPEDAWLDRQELATKLESDLRSKFWLFHPRQRNAEREFLADLRLLRRSERDEAPVAATLLAQRRARTFTRRRFLDSIPLSPAECDRRVERFFAKNGRYPDLDECKRLWSRGERGL